MAKAKRLLIVDDSEIDRGILRNILSRYFEITEAENGYAALKLITKKNSGIDGVLLDISMPIIDGFNVLEIMQVNDINVPIVLVTAEATAENVYRAVKYSIAGFISKPFEPRVILEKLDRIFGLESILTNVEIQEESSKKTDTFETDTFISKLTSLYKTYLNNINCDDLHCRRVFKLMKIMLAEYSIMNRIEIDNFDIRTISKAAYFYNIGLMGIPSELIANKELLTGDEREIYNSHTVMGANIISLNSSESCKYFVKVCADICMHHHERFDGTGYPHKLKGADNSPYAQLCSLAVKFDKLFVKRKEITDAQFTFVVNELKYDKGAFAPEMIDILLKCKGDILSYYKILEISNFEMLESSSAEMFD